MALREVLTPWPAIASITAMSDMTMAFLDKDHFWHLLAAIVWRKADLPYLRLLPLHRTASASLQVVGQEMRRTKIRKSILSPGLLCLVYNAGV